MDGRVERGSRGRHGRCGGVSPPRLPTSGHSGAGGGDAQAHQRGKRRPRHHSLGKGRRGPAAAAEAVFGVGRQDLRHPGVLDLPFVVLEHFARGL